MERGEARRGELRDGDPGGVPNMKSTNVSSPNAGSSSLRVRVRKVGERERERMWDGVLFEGSDGVGVEVLRYGGAHLPIAYSRRRGLEERERECVSVGGGVREWKRYV